MSATPTPAPIFRVTDPDTGLAIPGAKLHTYAAGSSAPQSTWADADKIATNTNPVIMDADGQAQVYLDGLYKFIVTRADDTLLYEIDDVIGGTSVFDKPASGVTLLPFDDITATNVQDGMEELGAKRVKITDIIQIDHGGTGQTTAWEGYDALASVDFDVLASATTTDLGSAESKKVRVTGVTTITGFGTAPAGLEREVSFAAALSINHNATSLILPTGVNVALGAGSSLYAVSLGSGNWRVVSLENTANYRYIGRQIITATGNYVASRGTKLARVRGCGGGGGGGGALTAAGGDSGAAAGGGGGAESGEFNYVVDAGAVIPISMGAGGAAGNSSGGDGGDGTNTIFDTVTFLGGKGGKGRSVADGVYQGASGGDGGTGGTGGVNPVRFAGSGGGAGIAVDSASAPANDIISGAGGACQLGGGGKGQYSSGSLSLNGQNGGTYGGGGSGAVSQNAAGGGTGGVGGAGVIIVEEFG